MRCAKRFTEIPHLLFPSSSSVQSFPADPTSLPPCPPIAVSTTSESPVSIGLALVGCPVLGSRLTLRSHGRSQTSGQVGTHHGVHSMCGAGRCTLMHAHLQLGDAPCSAQVCPISVGAARRVALRHKRPQRRSPRHFDEKLPEAWQAPAAPGSARRPCRRGCPTWTGRGSALSLWAW